MPFYGIIIQRVITATGLLENMPIDLAIQLFCRKTQVPRQKIDTCNIIRLCWIAIVSYYHSSSYYSHWAFIMHADRLGKSSLFYRQNELLWQQINTCNIVRLWWIAILWHYHSSSYYSHWAFRMHADRLGKSSLFYRETQMHWQQIDNCNVVGLCWIAIIWHGYPLILTIYYSHWAIRMHANIHW